MKNVLFIGPYRQQDGWGEAARRYIQELGQDVNLAVRPAYMGSSYIGIPDWLKPYEAAEFDHYDAVIQNVLPHFFEYDRRFGKNVCLFYSEATFRRTVWPEKLNMADAVFCPTAYDMKNCQKSGVTKPLYYVGFPSLHSLPTSTPLDLPPPHNSTFNFYFIGEYSERKNIKTLVRAFHLAFKPDEPVALILKVNKPGMPDEQLNQLVQRDIQAIQKELNLYPEGSYQPILVITGFIEDISMLHKACHCFVMPSHGESVNIPASDAYDLGNQVIMTAGIGHARTTSIQAVDWPCITNERPLPDLYTAVDEWKEPSLMDLTVQLREVVKHKDKVRPFFKSESKLLSSLESICRA